MAMQNGPLAGYEVDSMKVTLNDGSYHDVDSDQLSFELAAKIGFRNAAIYSNSSKGRLLQPERLKSRVKSNETECHTSEGA